MKTKAELLCEKQHDFDSLVSVMAALRSEGGCPWDMEQTHESVRKCLIEETYEVIEAIDNNDPTLLCEELGDLVFQAVFHARLEEEEGRFNMDNVIHGITHKMISRHPHVFADTKVSSSDEVLVNWDNIKKDEKQITGPVESLKRVPPYMPALLRAQKVQGKALSKYGFGEPDPENALIACAKALSEDGEITEKRLADLLVFITACAEKEGYDMEAALTRKTDMFIKTFEESFES